MTRRPLPTSPFNQAKVERPVPVLVLDHHVTHDTYGLGRVVSVEGTYALRVDFGAQQVRFVYPFEGLTPL